MAKNKANSVLITGAAQGIGRACVDYFAQQGWSVLALDQAQPEETFAKEIEFIQLDLADEAAIVAFGDNYSKREVPLGALINNAAIQPIGSMSETKASDWDLAMAVNLRAPYLLAKACLPYFSKKAAIVNIVSVHALATSADISAYAASKGGLLSLTRSMAIELAGRGIRVNAVLPGATDTEMLQAGLRRGELSDTESRKSLEDRILLGRLGRPDEIAKAVYFLADNDQSSYITGQSLIVDGGAMARLSTE
jgi:NAD(P)-dependent dehydrogenase (short-subunit alcohol dehydrogenase family)